MRFFAGPNFGFVRERSWLSSRGKEGFVDNRPPNLDNGVGLSWLQQVGLRSAPETTKIVEPKDSTSRRHEFVFECLRLG